VDRWTRYGKDRLYVSTEDGQRVGWLDLMTGMATVEMPECADAFHEAVRAHQARLMVSKGTSTPSTSDVSAEALAAPPPSASEEPPPSPSRLTPFVRHVAEVVEPAWTDLALNRPGQGVRAEAEALLAGMKEHSKVGTFLKRAFDVKTDERAFRVGADGEEAVGARQHVALVGVVAGVPLLGHLLQDAPDLGVAHADPVGEHLGPQPRVTQLLGGAGQRPAQRAIVALCPALLARGCVPVHPRLSTWGRNGFP